MSFIQSYNIVKILLIIYPGNRSLEFALVKICNRFPYCTESRNILSYCTGLRKGMPDKLLLPGGRHEGRIWQPFSFTVGAEETGK